MCINTDGGQMKVKTSINKWRHIMNADASIQCTRGSLNTFSTKCIWIICYRLCNNIIPTQFTAYGSVGIESPPPSSKHQRRRDCYPSRVQHLWNLCWETSKLSESSNTKTFCLYWNYWRCIYCILSDIHLDLHCFIMSLPDQIPSFSSSSCPSSQSSLRRGRWRHRAGRPAPPAPPAGRETSPQPDGTTGSSGCTHSSPQSGDKES